MSKPQWGTCNFPDCTTIPTVITPWILNDNPNTSVMTSNLLDVDVWLIIHGLYHTYTWKKYSKTIWMLHSLVQNGSWVRVPQTRTLKKKGSPLQGAKVLYWLQTWRQQLFEMTSAHSMLHAHCDNCEHWASNSVNTITTEYKAIKEEAVEEEVIKHPTFIDLTDDSSFGNASSSGGFSCWTQPWLKWRNTTSPQSDSEVFDLDENPCSLVPNDLSASIGEWANNIETRLKQKAARSPQLLTTKEIDAKKKTIRYRLRAGMYVQDVKRLPNRHRRTEQKGLRQPSQTKQFNTNGTASISRHSQKSWTTVKLSGSAIIVKANGDRMYTRTLYASVPFKHILLGNVITKGLSHFEIVDRLPPGWKPVDFDGTLSSTEIELAYLQEESQHCQKMEDWNFVWTYASPLLRMQLRRLTFVRPENYAAFEAKKLEIRKQLALGSRRPLMGRIMAEYRLKTVTKQELTCAPTYEEVFLTKRIAIQSPVITREKVTKFKLVKKPKSLERKASRRRSTELIQRSPRNCGPSNIHNGCTDRSHRHSATTCISDLPSAHLQSTQLDNDLPRSLVLYAQEQEVVWLGEESILDHPDPKGFDFDFVSTHASATLKAHLLTRSSGRWLQRVVRFHDAKVRGEFNIFRVKVRACLYSGYRRPETKEFLPAQHIPLPSWTLTKMAFEQAFEK